MGFLVIVAIIIFGFLLIQPLLGKLKIINPLPYCFLYGSLITVPLLYFLTAYITHSLFWGIFVWVSVGTFLTLLYFIFPPKKLISLQQIIIFVLVSAIFYLLPYKTFQYHDNTFYIASNLYLDMGAHIPIIRSFSSGVNLPFEVPYFAGQHLTYHFLYDFLTGVLEYSGLRIDLAYNLIFALTLASFFFVFMDVGKIIFKSKAVGLIAFILFIFPPDLSFFSLLKNGMSDLPTIVRNNNMYHINSFLGDRTIGGFLYINTYLNQRHLFIALAISMVLLLPLWNFLNVKSKEKDLVRYMLIGIAITFIIFWNVPVFLMMSFLYIELPIIFSKGMKDIIFGAVMLLLFSILPLSLIMANSANSIHLELGFLVHNNLSLPNFLLLWIFNLGFAMLTIIGGFFVSQKNQKKLFMGLLPLFIIPNLFQIAKDMFDNHKFFNFWFLYTCFFSALFLVYLFRHNRFTRIMCFPLIVLLVASGIVNFLVVKNDVLAPIPDYAVNTSVIKTMRTFPQKSVIMTNGETYDPLSVSGRKTYLGRLNDIYAYGGDPQERVSVQEDLFLHASKKSIKALQKEKIEYIIIYKDLSVHNLRAVSKSSLNKNLKKLYEDNFLILYKI